MIDRKIVVAVIKGAITFIPGANYFLNIKRKKTRHSGANALFSYSLWLTNLVYFVEQKIQPDFSRLAEIGNGGSLGLAFCAFLTGTKKYFSFEYRDNIDFQEQIELLEIISLFFDKSEPIHYFEKINIKVTDYSFPEQIVLPKEQRTKLLQLLKLDLQNKLVGSELIILVNNWEVQNPLNISFVFSRAVMEHVKSPLAIYKALKIHMNEDALMLHDIEFHSHGITSMHGDHRKISFWLWFIIFGKRPFYLNRLNMFDHIHLIANSGFSILKSDERFIGNSHLSFGGVIVGKRQ